MSYLWIEHGQRGTRGLTRMFVKPLQGYTVTIILNLMTLSFN